MLGAGRNLARFTGVGIFGAKGVKFYFYIFYTVQKHHFGATLFLLCEISEFDLSHLIKRTRRLFGGETLKN